MVGRRSERSETKRETRQLSQFFFFGTGNPEITKARNISSPPRARWRTIDSPPSVQAKIAAKTGSSAKISDTRSADLIFWAAIWITKAESVGKSARNSIIQKASVDTISNGRENINADKILKKPTNKN